MAETIMITGASRGIGLALSLAFAKSGWTVFAGARTPDAPLLRNASHEFPNLHPLRLDVLDDEDCGHAAREAARQIRGLDVLVNNAAVFPGEGKERLEQLDLSWFAEAIETNVTGVARVTRAFLPLLRRGDVPRVINISSGAGSIADKTDHFYYPYSVSKAALNMLTRAMAAEFQPEGIAVVAVSPGWVRTEMGGPNAPLTAEQSARSLFGTIRRLTLAQTGTFIGRDGPSPEYCW